jgi:hypothetical protein
MSDKTFLEVARTAETVAGARGYSTLHRAAKAAFSAIQTCLRAGSGGGRRLRKDTGGKPLGLH